MMHDLVNSCEKDANLFKLNEGNLENLGWTAPLVSCDHLRFEFNSRRLASPVLTLDELLLDILRFRDERDWGQFHTPKNLAAALSIEVGEVQEIMLWKTDAEVADLIRSQKGKMRLEEEIADVLIFTLLLAYEVGLNPAEAIQRKILQNAVKYPVEFSKGNAVKYSERQTSRKHLADIREDAQQQSGRSAQGSLFPVNPSSVV
jgi:dCTP diphosphatase